VVLGSGSKIKLTLHQVHRKRVRRARYGHWGGKAVDPNWPKSEEGKIWTLGRQSCGPQLAEPLLRQLPIQ